ncbi:MAG: AroB-related putative sugar phosphate phospholyase (cyclizing) [Pseudomonadota bacterium]
MFENLTIQSHKGPYTVVFDDALLSNTASLSAGECHFLVDANVARLYSNQLAAIVSHPNLILIEASEDSKSLQKIIPVIERLVQNNVRRDHTLVAIGGGVVQDITCFIASTLLRGVRWRFAPTTLLAQADSCIGSKSSINLGSTKNILGTFNPPYEIFVDKNFLDTLEDKEIRSGVGEILKVHAIEGLASFDLVARDFENLFLKKDVLMKYVRSALLIKQRFIEPDEFDRGIRNVFNYGHSFGHAIESATNYAVPHGIAVSMGMDMANHIAVQRGLLPARHYVRMHGVLSQNYSHYEKIHIPIDAMLSALMRDKKNTSALLGLILPSGEDAIVQPVKVAPDEVFRGQCAKFLAEAVA